MANAAHLHTKRILVVTANSSLAAGLEAALEECGCAMIGPVWSVEDADDLALGLALDGAVIDTEQPCAVATADLLRMLKIPFVFVADGFGARPARHAAVPLLDTAPDERLSAIGPTYPLQPPLGVDAAFRRLGLQAGEP